MRECQIQFFSRQPTDVSEAVRFEHVKVDGVSVRSLKVFNFHQCYAETFNATGTCSDWDIPSCATVLENGCYRPPSKLRTKLPSLADYADPVTKEERFAEFVLARDSPIVEFRTFLP